MIKWLGAAVIGNPWLLVAVVSAVGLTHAAAYVKGRWDGGQLAQLRTVEQFNGVIDGISNKAEKARAMSRACSARGLQFDTERGRCVE